MIVIAPCYMFFDVLVPLDNTICVENRHISDLKSASRVGPYAAQSSSLFEV